MVTKALSGGGKLTKRLAEIAKKTGAAGGVDVGFLEGATYPDGKSVAMVAAIQEFGAPAKNIPPRPFFRGTIADKGDGWGDAMAATLKASDYDAAKALGMMGEGIKGQLQTSIRDLSEPPNAPATVAKKGFDDPLIDTGHLLNSVDYAVKK